MYFPTGSPDQKDIRSARHRHSPNSCRCLPKRIGRGKPKLKREKKKNRQGNENLKKVLRAAAAAASPFLSEGICVCVGNKTKNKKENPRVPLSALPDRGSG